MSLIQVFEDSYKVTGWFDDTAVIEGWLDDDFSHGGLQNLSRAAADNAAASDTVARQLTQSRPINEGTLADITLRSAITGTNAQGATSLAITLPAGILGGDYIVIRWSCNSNTTLDLPSGYTRIQDLQNQSGTSSSTYAKYAAGTFGSASSDASATVTVNYGVSTRASAIGDVWYNVDQTTGLDNTPTANAPSSGVTTYTYPAITSATNKALITIYGTGQIPSGSSQVWTQPSGFSNAGISQSAAGSGNNNFTVKASKSTTTAGSNGTWADSFTVTTTATGLADTFAFRPALGSAPADTLTKSFSYGRTASDTASASDTVSRAINVSRVTVDPFPIADSFDRADGPLGSNWTEVGTGSAAIASNQVSRTSVIGVESYAGTTLSTNDNWSGLILAVASGSSTGPMCRMPTSAAHTGYFLQASSSGYRLYSLSAGTLNPLTGYVGTMTSGDQMVVSAVGTTINGYVNGVNILTATDSSITTGNRIGFRISNDSTVRIDGFYGADSSQSIPLDTLSSHISQAYKTATDTAAASDTVARLLSNPRPISDASGGSDTLVSHISQAFKTASDASAGTDTIARQLSLPRPISDTSNGSDAIVSHISQAFKTVADTAGGTDAIARLLSLPRPISDAAGGTDSVGQDIPHAYKTVADNAVASDAIVRVLSLPRPISDTAAATDVATFVSSKGRTASDASGGTDAIGRGLSLPRAISDTGAGSDTIARQLSLPRAISDTGSGSDTLSSHISQAYKTVSDTASGTDTVDRQLSLPRAVADSAPAVDTETHSYTPAGGGSQSRSAADNAAASDTVARLLSQPRPVSDNAAGSDTITATKSLHKTVSDIATTTDCINDQLILNGYIDLGNNTNWPSTTFDAGTTYNGHGSVKMGVGQTTIVTGSTVPIDTSASYSLIGAMQIDVSAGQQYIGFMPYDVDGNQIRPYHVWGQAGTDTTLASDLVNGATTVTLTSSANWYNGASAAQRYITLYNWVDGRGTAWPANTYSRNQLLYNSGAISGNVITLASTYAGPTVPAGTSVSNTQSGGTYRYTPHSGITQPAGSWWVDSLVEAGGLQRNWSVNQHVYGTYGYRVVYLNLVNATSQIWVGQAELIRQYALTVSLPRPITDSAPASDALSSHIPQAYKTAADSAPAVDSISANINVSRTASDSAAATDSATRQIQRPRSAPDSAGGTDTASRLASLPRGIAENAAASDIISRVIHVYRTTADSAPTSDTASMSIGKNRTASDMAALTDNVTISKSFLRLIDDSAPTVENVSGVTQYSTDRTTYFGDATGFNNNIDFGTGRGTDAVATTGAGVGMRGGTGRGVDFDS